MAPGEAQLRKDVALRLAHSASSWVTAGILERMEFERWAITHETAVLSVQECRWVNYEGIRGEIDVVVPLLGIAVECKARGPRARMNWEEALGQALRDREIPWVHYTYVAVWADEMTPWLVATAASNDVGIITHLGRGSLSVRFHSHPRAAKAQEWRG